MPEWVGQLVAFLVWLWESFPEFRFMVAHVAVNLTVAVAVALYTGQFELKRLGGFLVRKLAPFVLIYGVVRVLGAEAGLEWLAVAVWVIIEATLVGDLADNLARLGVPVPEWMQARIGAGATLIENDPSDRAGVPVGVYHIGEDGVITALVEDDDEPVPRD
jgi:phage-related holin